MSPKRITIEDLAIMVARGFEDIQARMVTKDELVAEFASFRIEINKKFEDLEERFLYRYDSRFEKVEDDMRLVKTKLGM